MKIPVYETASKRESGEPILRAVDITLVESTEVDSREEGDLGRNFRAEGHVSDLLNDGSLEYTEASYSGRMGIFKPKSGQEVEDLIPFMYLQVRMAANGGEEDAYSSQRSTAFPEKFIEIISVQEDFDEELIDSLQRALSFGDRKPELGSVEARDIA